MEWRQSAGTTEIDSWREAALPTLDIRILENGRGLRRAYVEHIVGTIGAPQMYQTNDQGIVRDEEGNPGLESATPWADLRILCQNSVVKMLDGATPGPLAVNQDAPNRVTDTAVNLNTAAEQRNWYELANTFLVAYDVAFRQFEVFADLPDPDFPLGRRSTLRQSKDQQQRIEVSFPSQFPGAQAAFTEPSSAATGYPLIHLRAQDFNNRRITVPAELAHALHFSRFSQSRRNSIETDYLAWIAVDVANNPTDPEAGRHRVGRRTSPKVAFIEALDQFSHRFCEYVRVEEQDGSPILAPQVITSNIRRRFIASELSGNPVTGASVGVLDAAGNVDPDGALQGSDDEGSVYGCIFLDFGRRVGLRTAVNAYFRSASKGVLTFGGYRNFIRDTRPQHLAELDAARETWGV
jgi:hypothetical protein